MAQEHQEPASDIREDSEADPGLAPHHPYKKPSTGRQQKIDEELRIQKAINRDRAMSKK